MRSRSPIIPSLFSALLLLSSAAQVRAHPYPKDDLHDVGYSYLMPRACAVYCGEYNQYCCEAGSACYTEAGIAKCGGQNVFTTTWTETNTFTSTVTTKWADATPTPVDKSVPCVPQSDDWSPCGWVCCDYWQQCAVEGQCVAKPGYEGGPPGGGGIPTVITTDGVVTTLYSSPFRTTGSDAAGPAPTFDAGQPEETNGGGGLSAGAIAGIVIGSLAGVGILMMICFCCIAKGLWGLIFGGKKKDRERTREEIYDEKYTRSSRPSSYYTKDHHSTWYGSSSAGTRPEKKKSGAKWLGIGAMAATLLALLNIKKDKKPPSRRTPTMYSSSYVTGTGTSPSSSSSGGPSRHYSRSGTHRSPRSYYSHHTRQTGGPRSSRRSSRH